MYINSDWNYYLNNEMAKPYFKQLKNEVNQLYREHTVYPPKHLVFEALNQTSFEQTKVVILGQDPYHGPNQANGLSFSVHSNQPLPPSLKNIYKELGNDTRCSIPNHGDLSSWAKQGVLLLNTVLTVEKSLANSHRDLGWETFTDRILQLLNDHKTHIVFILWGKHAQQKGAFIDRDKHLVLQAPHPSPLSAYRGFFNSRPFSKANTYLEQHEKAPIYWCLKK